MNIQSEMGVDKNEGRNMRIVRKIPSDFVICCVKRKCVRARRAERHQVRVPEGKGVLLRQEDSLVAKAGGEPEGREVV